MKLALFDFQEAAVEALLTRLKAATTLAAEGVPQAVILSAPTGAGKTVIATATIEALLVGSEEQPPDPAAAFLWVTDQPQLNTQTMRKMIAASSGLEGPNLVAIEEPGFAAKKLAPGNVYFINTQKLAASASLVKPRDGRELTFWEAYANTIEDPGVNLYVVIDEAHRGAGQTSDGEVLPIMQRFLMGFEDERFACPPAPVTLGISATPERFERLLEGGIHGKQPVQVSPDDVRASGLIKDRIHIVMPEAGRQDDLALLRAAASEWLASREAWRAYSKRTGEPLVDPVLVVQVEDGDEARLSKTDLAGAVRAIREIAGSHVEGEGAFAHSFGRRETDETVDGIELRYLPAAEIDADPDVRVVFFKASLNQGWDCPRAEVMMSFRRHQDATLIAQLVGRMVRTPLARRIEAQDELNGVLLYLPHFDEDEVELVRRELMGVPSEVDEGVEPPVTLVRRPGSEAAFEALEGLPSYAVPRRRRTKQTRRATLLATLLDRYGIEEDASGEMERRLVAVLLDAQRDREGEDGFEDAVSAGGTISVVGKTYDPYGADVGAEDRRLDISASAENARHLFGYAGRVFGAALHKPYWRARVEAAGMEASSRAMFEAAVLASDEETVGALEEEARWAADKLLREHGAAIDRLGGEARVRFDRVRGLAGEEFEIGLALPQSIAVRRGKRSPRSHLYVEAGGKNAPIGLHGWEREAVEAEVERDDNRGWLRNLDRKDFSLTIPYRMPELRPMYPDILSLRVEGDRLRVDLLDPHNPQLPDAIAKAHGMAVFAKKHGHRFGRIELIAKLDGALRRIDLQSSATRERVLAVKTNDALEQLYG